MLSFGRSLRITATCPVSTITSPQSVHASREQDDQAGDWRGETTAIGGYFPIHPQPNFNLGFILAQLSAATLSRRRKSPMFAIRNLSAVAFLAAIAGATTAHADDGEFRNN